MSRLLIDLTGKRFGTWTVLYRSGTYVSHDKSHTIPVWRCRCDCGATADVPGNNLRSGVSTGCKKCSGPKISAAQKAYHLRKRLQGGAVYAR